MFERHFNRFDTRFDARGSRCADNACACADTADSISLLSLDTVLAVSIFAVLRLIIIRLVSLISVGVIVGGTASKRPRLASAD